MFAKILAHPAALGVWASVVALCLILLFRDLRHLNPAITGLMRWVWILTVLYSGPLGLLVYGYSGRAQIRRDSLWRRALRSVSHCYSGCGAGEIAGVSIAAGVFNLGTWWVSGISFGLAYAAGFSLTVGPLVQEGVALPRALWDAFTSETASITVMEVAAIGSDIWLAGGAGFGDALFWSSLVLSLSVGLLAAYPVNVLLILTGVKKGMHSPAEMARHGHG
jgi:hypothetical protein